MFGFPSQLSQYGLKEYIRLLVIVCAYILLRPLFQRIFSKLGERARLREKKKIEAEKAREYQEQRVKERLGIQETVEETASTGSIASTKSVRNRLKTQKGPKKSAPIADMDSDEDVSDLLG